MLDRVREWANDFDILHFHIDQFHFPLFRPRAGSTLTTLHGRQDLPDLRPLYFGFSEMPLVSISDAQRAPIQNANFAATVYHGLPIDLHWRRLTPAVVIWHFSDAFRRRKASIAPSRWRGHSASLSRSLPKWTESTKSISASKLLPCSKSLEWSSSVKS